MVFVEHQVIIVKPFHGLFLQYKTMEWFNKNSPELNKKAESLQNNSGLKGICMKTNLLLLLIVFLAISCNQQKSSDKEIQIVEEEIFDENEEEYIESIKYKGTKTYLKLISNCNKNNYPDEELLSKYARKQPYDIIKTEKGKRIVIEFSFLDDCCTRHAADVEFRDTVKVKTVQIGDEVCECYCNYRYSISVSKEKVTDKKIEINNFEIK